MTVCAGTVPYDAICVVMVLLHDDRPLAIFSGIRYCITFFFCLFLLCPFVSFVRISSGIRWTFRRVLCGKTFLLQEFATNSFARISLGFHENFV